MAEKKIMYLVSKMIEQDGCFGYGEPRIVFAQNKDGENYIREQGDGSKGFIIEPIEVRF